MPVQGRAALCWSLGFADLAVVSVATTVTVAMSSEVATAVSESGISNAGVSAAVSVSTSVSVSSIGVATKAIAIAIVGISLSLSIGLSLPLGNVDSSNRVSPVVAGGSIPVGDVGTNSGRGAVAADGDGGGVVDSRGGVGVVDGRGGDNRGSDGPGGNDGGNSGGVDGRGGNGVVNTSVAGASVTSVHTVEGLGLTLSVVSPGVTSVADSVATAVESRVSNAAVAETISSVSSIASEARVSIAEVGVSLGIGLSSSKGRTAEQNSKPEHLPCLARGQPRPRPQQQQRPHSRTDQQA